MNENESLNYEPINPFSDPGQAQQVAPEQSAYTEPAAAHTASEGKPTQKPLRVYSKRFIAGIAAACIMASAAAGFGGSIAANAILGSLSSAGKAVIYQAVQNTAASSGTTGEILTTAQVAALALNTVVEVTTETVSKNNRMQQYVSEGAGSGVVITKDGYIVTNNHVVTGATKITVRLSDGTEYTATLVGSDIVTDIAVLKINASNLQAAVLGDSTKIIVGETAIAIGNPLGALGGTVTDGIISALDREITIDGETMNLLQTNAAINPGNSGGGLFNSKGELVGIVNAKSSALGVEGLGFAIPINTVKPIVEQLITNGKVQGRIAMGVTIVNISDAAAATQYGVQELGVYLMKVADGSDAQKAGLQEGDLFVSIDGEKVTDASQIKTIVAKHKAGDKITVIVKRDGKEVTCSLTFTSGT